MMLISDHSISDIYECKKYNEVLQNEKNVFKTCNAVKRILQTTMSYKN